MSIGHRVMTCQLKRFAWNHTNFRHRKIPAPGAGGFSLLEVLMIIALMSTIIIPFIILMTQTSMTARGAYIQSSRSLVLNKLMDQMSPERNDFYDTFDSGSSPINSMTESGQNIPYMRRVDTSASNSMDRTTYFYLYNNTTDASTAFRYRASLTQTTDFVNLDENGAFPQADGTVWGVDQVYNSTKSISGMTTATGGTTICDSSVLNYINVNDTYQDQLFSCNWVQSTGTTIQERFNVANGNYNVKLYFSNHSFADQSLTINDTTNRILMDIYIEGVPVQTSYSPYEAMKSMVTPSTVPTKSVSALSFDTTVTDGVLNVQLMPNANTTYPPYLTAISVKRRRSQ